MQPQGSETLGVATREWDWTLPSPIPGALRQTPCLRIADVLPAIVAEALRQELLHGLVYERVELGDVTRQWRAARPFGDVYYGSMQRRPGWTTPTAVEAALAWFESSAFVSWLSVFAAEELMFLRPVTAYRMDIGDRLCLHDDMSDRRHAVSVAYNVTADWRPEWGGATVFGEVTDVTSLPTPPDSPIELRQWHVREPLHFMPLFNSLLLMRLDRSYAHGVEEVSVDHQRLALVGIYGRATSD